MKRVVIIIITAAILMVLLLALYQTNKPQSSLRAPTPKPVITPTRLLTPTPEKQHADWQTFNDTIQHISFAYPATLQTNYIRPQSWPPHLIVSADTFSCKQGVQMEGQLLVIQKTIGGTTYCITKMTQGAAGTSYSDFTYTFVKNSRLIKLAFTLAYPQCGNYPDPQMSACQKERQTFDLDTLIDQIAQTITIQDGNQQSTKPIVTSLQPNEKVSSPLLINGSVPSGWMFEGVFPLKLLDADRKIIAQTQAKEVAPGSWNSGRAVAFQATIHFATSAKTGFLVLEKDNPSGLPAHVDSYEVPVTF